MKRLLAIFLLLLTAIVFAQQPMNHNSVVEINESEVQYDDSKIKGRKVLNVLNGKQTKGTHKLTINSENLSSGTYNVILKSCGKSVAEKVVVVK